MSTRGRLKKGMAIDCENGADDDKSGIKREAGEEEEETVAGPLLNRPPLAGGGGGPRPRGRPPANGIKVGLEENLSNLLAGRKSGDNLRGFIKIFESDSEDDCLKNESEDEEYTPNRYGRGKKRRKMSPGEQLTVRRRTVPDPDAKKEFFNDVSKMCLCRCNICNKSFLHHRMIKHIERTHKQGVKDKFVFVTQTYYRCKLCDAEMLFSFYNIGQHVKRCHKMTLQDYKTQIKDAFTGELELQEEEDEEPESIPKVYSEDLSDMCLVKCNLCGEVAFYHLLKLHLIREHQETMEPHGRLHFVKKTFYKCKICDSEVLFHFDSISKHCSEAHKMTLKAYRTEYPAFTGQHVYNQTLKTKWAGENNKSSKKLRSGFDPAAEEKWRPTVDGSRKYLSDNLKEVCLRKCGLCKHVIKHDYLKNHLASEHKEESQPYDLTAHEFVRLTHHRCRICKKDILFSYINIAHHTKRCHKISFKDYDKTHAVFTENGDQPGYFEDAVIAVKSEVRVSNGIARHKLGRGGTVHAASAAVASCPVLLQPVAAESGHFAHRSILFQPPPHPNLPIARKSRAVVVDDDDVGVMVPDGGGGGSNTVGPALLARPMSGRPEPGVETIRQANHAASGGILSSAPSLAPTTLATPAPWYDGNTFSCAECGYADCSLRKYEEHVRGQHATEPVDLAAHQVLGSAKYYRCECCRQQLYHEESTIRKHLLEQHSLSLDAYSQLYEPSQPLLLAF